jgi:pyrroloquinoline quinone biosynthesis protein B
MNRSFNLRLTIVSLFSFIIFTQSAYPQEDKMGPGVKLIILGTFQDGGSPHIGCKKDCCVDLFENPDKNRMVVSLGVIDEINKKTYLIEATPDISRQLHLLREASTFAKSDIPDAIFLTHAHIGHYTGLMYFGKEALNSTDLAVYTLPRMQYFLENNGPWSQLIDIDNIEIEKMQADQSVNLSENLSITPFEVPHRDEYSETIGFRIKGPSKTAIFIPDIDKWKHWKKSIHDEIKNADYLYVDATFYDENEILSCDMSEIPHPFIVESMSLFDHMSDEDKKKIHFIHFNHTNPVIDSNSKAAKTVISKGYNLAEIYSVKDL